MGDDVIVTSYCISFLQTNVHISNAIEPANFVLGTNTQLHNVHLMIEMKVTLKVTGEGQRSQKMNLWSYVVNYYTHRHHTWYQCKYNKRHLMT